MRSFSILLLIITGCSLLKTEEIQNTPPFSSLELTLSRYSLTGAEFEHYKLDHGKLFWECGGMRRNRYNPKDQQLSTIPLEKEKNIRAHVVKLTEAIDDSESEWQPAGKLTSLADPGEIKLDLKTANKSYQVITSLDSVSTPTSKKEQMLQKTVNAIRKSLSKAPCNNKTFYGFANMLE